MTNRQKIFLIAGIIILALVALVEGFFLLRQSGLGNNMALAYRKALAQPPGSETDSSPAPNQLSAEDELILQETADDLARMQDQINRLFYEMTRDPVFSRRSSGIFSAARNPFVPLDNIQRLQSEIARIFRSEHDSRHGGALNLIERDWHDVRATSAINLEEDGTNYAVTVSAPGFEKGDIAIRINNRILTIEAASARQNNAQNPRSIQSGRFTTQIMLPGDITGEGARASYENGILRIMIPRNQAPNSLARKVTIM